MKGLHVSTWLADRLRETAGTSHKNIMQPLARSSASYQSGVLGGARSRHDEDLQDVRVSSCRTGR